MFGFKSAQQKRIDELAAENAVLLKEVADTGVLLTKANEHIGWADNQTRAAIHERDAARIERDTAQRERDGYRDDALKYRANKARLKAANDRRHEDALQRAAQPKPTNGAAAQAVVS